MYDLNIDGFMAECELKQIVKWAELVPENGIIVEVGSYKGRSSIAWATSCDPSVTVYCMDLFDDFSEPYYEEFTKNTKHIPNIQSMKCIVPYVMADWTDRMIDVFFLDGMHENPFDIDAIKYFLPWIKKGGMICGHDYYPDKKEFPDILSNVEYLEETLNKKVTNYIKDGSSLWSFIV